MISLFMISMSRMLWRAWSRKTKLLKMLRAMSSLEEQATMHHLKNSSNCLNLWYWIAIGLSQSKHRTLTHFGSCLCFHQISPKTKHSSFTSLTKRDIDHLDITKNQAISIIRPIKLSIYLHQRSKSIFSLKFCAILLLSISKRFQVVLQNVSIHTSDW